jgi:hypothetical protein
MDLTYRLIKTWRALRQQLPDEVQWPSVIGWTLAFGYIVFCTVISLLYPYG